MRQYCQVPVGELIAHPCGAATRELCTECGQPACAPHLESGRCGSCRGEASRALIRVKWKEMWDWDVDDAALFDGRPPTPDEALGDYDS